ncbi:MAG: 16S rRNA (cytosine(1402)-N(4))-methyltransferase RsmH [Thermodesulfobacteriota bacterium]
MEGSRHLPVLLPEVLEYLACQPDRVYVDGTLGSGGHARAILERSSPTGRLIGLDWDEQAIQRAKENLAGFGNRVELQKENFKDLRWVLKSLSLTAVHGILLDLGVSTERLEDREKGFSFRWDGPLDMRMSRETKITAQDLLQKLSVWEMSGILREYGEERWANRISRAIGRRRQTRAIQTTRELVEVIEKSVPFHRGRIHPATRTFQALRIAVNDELGNLKTFLAECPDLLFPGGRLCIISFHSLEDRIVKNHFRQWAKGPEGGSPSFRILTPKPVVPSSAEVLSNPKARSAKLRVAEKLSET